MLRSAWHTRMKKAASHESKVCTFKVKLHMSIQNSSDIPFVADAAAAAAAAD